MLQVSFRLGGDGDPTLFMTRWMTHFCAAVFVFLAGVSAYLYGARGRSTDVKSEVDRWAPIVKASGALLE